MPAKKSSKSPKSVDSGKHAVLVANKRKNTAERHLADTIASCREKIEKAQGQFDDAVARVKDAKYLKKSSHKTKKSSKKSESRSKRSAPKRVTKSPAQKKRAR